jgi:hypothetical protein
VIGAAVPAMAIRRGRAWRSSALTGAEVTGAAVDVVEAWSASTAATSATIAREYFISTWKRE